MGERTVTIRLKIEGEEGEKAAQRLRNHFKRIDEEIENTGKKISSVLDKATAYALKAAQEIQRHLAALDLSHFLGQLEEVKRLLQQTQNLKQPTTTRNNPATPDLQMQRALSDIKRFQSVRMQMEREYTALVDRQAEAQYQARTRQMQRSANDFLKILEKEKRASQSSGNSNASSVLSDVFGGTLLGSFIGGGIANAIGAAISEIKQLATEIVNLGIKSAQTAATFQKQVNALTAISGSAAVARKELAELETLARNTPGLGLETAQNGYLQLRAVGFEAERNKQILTGLSKIQILSGGSRQDLEAVLYNLTQIRSMGKLTGDELRETLGRLPAIAPVIQRAFGTINTEKIRDYNLSSEQFFDALLKELDKVPPVVGGASDAYQKLLDQLYIAKREFGQPLLEPSTNSIRELTEYLEQNRRAWRIWGEETAKVIEGAGISLKVLKQQLTGIPVGNEQTEDDYRLGVKVLLAASPPLAILNAIAEFNKKPDLKQNFEKVDFESVLRGSGNKEADNFKKNLDTINSLRSNELASADNFYNQKLAIISRGVRASAETEYQYQIQRSEIEKNSINDRLGVMRKAYDDEAALTQKFINSVPEQFRSQVRFEKERELSGKLVDLRKSEIEAMQKFADMERQNQEANLRLQNQQLERYRGEALSFLEQSYKVEQARTASVLTFTVEQTKAAAIEEINARRDNLTEQLDIQTAHFNNLQNLYAFDAGKLAEIYSERNKVLGDLNAELQVNEYNHQRQIAEFERKSLEESKQRLSDYAQFAQQIYLSRAGIYQSIGELFNPATFNANQTSKGLIGNYYSDVESLTKNFNSTSADKVRIAREQNKFSPVSDSLVDRETWGRLNKEFEQAKKLADDYKKSLDGLNGSIPKVYFSLDALSQQISKGNVRAFDAASKAVLEYRQQLEKASLQSEIDLAKDLLQLEQQNSKDPQKILQYQANLNKLLSSQSKQSIDQQIESIGQYNQSLAGLEETLRNIRSGDVAGLRYNAQKQVLQEQISLYGESIYLEEKLAKQSEDSAIRYRNAWLQAIYDVRDADIQAVESQIASQIRIADNATLHIEQVRAKVLEHLASQKSLSESIADGIISAFDKAADYFDKRLGKIADIPILGDLAKFANRSFLSNITTSLMDTFLPGVSQQMEAAKNPLLAENKEQTKLLRQLVSNTGGGAGVSQNIFSSPNIIGGGFGGGFGGNSGGGIFSNILGGLLGGAKLFGGSGSMGTRTGDVLDGVTQIFAGDNGRSDIWSNIKSVFSGKEGTFFGKGGFFGKDGLGFNGGTTGALGSIAQLFGSLIGGRVGGVISMAGTGASIGSMFGGIGGAIGAGVGALVGLFTNSQRKSDEQTRTQALQIASGEFDKLISALNTRPPQIEASAARSQADQIISQYNSAMSALKDRKTREIALREWTHPQGHLYSKNQQLNDAMQNSLKWLADEQNRKKVSESFTGEFANGIYMNQPFRTQYDEFKRYNGLLPGAYSGKDYIQALIGDGEMVLNAVQQSRVIANARAGYDNPFMDAGIPNYKSFSEPSRFAGGVSLSPVTVSGGGVKTNSEPSVINVNLTVEGEIDKLRIKNVTMETLNSTEGKSVVFGTIKSAIQYKGRY